MKTLQISKKHFFHHVIVQTHLRVMASLSAGEIDANLYPSSRSPNQSTQAICRITTFTFESNVENVQDHVVCGIRLVRFVC